MFVIYVAIWKQEKISVHFKRQVQIKAKVRALLFNKNLIEISAKYFDYSNIFSAEYIVELPEIIKINEHAIKLEKDKQPLFGSIYNLEPIELEILKIYIITTLANGFIQPSKFSARALILFDKRLNGNFCFYVDY